MTKYLIILIIFILLIPRITTLSNKYNLVIDSKNKLIGDFPISIKNKKIKIV